MRLFLGFAILPFVAAVLAYFGFPLFARSLLNQIGGSFSGDGAGAFAFATAIVALFVTVLGAVPLVSKMSKRGPITFTQALVAGVALGNAPFLIAAALVIIGHAFAGSSMHPNALWYGATGFVRMITTGTVLGAALGSVFWFVGIRERT